MSFSDEGLSLRAEGRADAATPLSLDSALQERLQQERASMQSQIELLEKKKNEEIQNLKTSLIAEQQVCNWALNVLEMYCACDVQVWFGRLYLIKNL